MAPQKGESQTVTFFENIDEELKQKLMIDEIGRSLEINIRIESNQARKMAITNEK